MILILSNREIESSECSWDVQGRLRCCQHQQSVQMSAAQSSMQIVVPQFSGTLARIAFGES